MPIFKSTIFTGFSPNLTGRDTGLALSYLFFPWRWSKIRNGKFVKLAENKIRHYFNIRQAFAFDSGRSALHYALKALGAEEGDEILVQAYTCVVVANAIKWTGAKPVYVDIDDGFNMSPASLESRLTNKSKILIIQHTFGLPAKLNELLDIAKHHNLKVIEDCAHSLGARYDGELTGAFGDIGMLSFGSDKIISCVRGGALITANDAIAAKLQSYYDQLTKPSLPKTIQHLFHYPIFYIAKPVYNLYIGKIILKLAKKLNIINKIIYKPEKAGERVNFYPAKLANALANILCLQLDKIDELNRHRQSIARFYNEHLKNEQIVIPAQAGIRKFENSVFLRYPILTENPKKLMAFAKKQGIILGDWYNAPITPGDLNKTGYKAGSCPNAERLAALSVNLPTDRHINDKHAKMVVKIINSFKMSD